MTARLSDPLGTDRGIRQGFPLGDPTDYTGASLAPTLIVISPPGTGWLTTGWNKCLCAVLVENSVVKPGIGVIITTK